MRRVWSVFVLAACGRLSFDPVDDGGASGDGPRGDGTGDASGVDDTICDDNLPGVLFCESFESGLQAFPSTEATPPTFVVDDTSRAHRGSRSLRAHATRLNEPAWIIASALPAVMSGELWARWYIYIPPMPAQFDWASVHVVDQNAPNNGFHVGFTESIFAISATEAGTSNGSTMAIARDQWLCVQVRVVIANAGGSVETWLEGLSGPAISNIDTLPAGGYTNVHAGMFSAALGPVPREMWTDELVIGTLPIPCD